jgi:hypothetical protein
LGELEGVGEGMWVRKRAGAGKKKKAKVQIKSHPKRDRYRLPDVHSRGWLSLARFPSSSAMRGSSSWARSHPRVGDVSLVFYKRLAGC